MNKYRNKKMFSYKWRGNRYNQKNKNSKWTPKTPKKIINGGVLYPINDENKYFSDALDKQILF